jgi:hypothetical protein
LLVTSKRLPDEADIPDTGIAPQAAVGMTMAERYEWHQAYLRRHRVSRRGFLYGSAAASRRSVFHRSVRALTHRMRH